ncbi:MAG: FKBP-type peptidyl-prolyl cis-trans isomerase [Phototrophicaceae bacterium]
MSLTLTENKIGAIAYDIYVDGNLVETVTEDDSIEYLHGGDNIVPGLERALEGKKADDTFDVTVEPKDAYGDYDDDLIEEIPAEDFNFDEEGMELEVGLEVEMMDEDGDILEGTVVGIEGDNVLVDLNPPLAGKTIRYVGKVLSVREPNEEELEWGFPESLLDDMFGEEDDFDDED